MTTLCRAAYAVVIERKEGWESERGIEGKTYHKLGVLEIKVNAR